MCVCVLVLNPQNPVHLASQGFGQSPRGCGCFGDKSINIFLEKYNFQHIFRGHEAQKSGHITRPVFVPHPRTQALELAQMRA